MQAINYSQARNHLKSLIDRVCEEDEEVIITTKNDKSVVMMSLEQYNLTHTKIKKEVAKALQQVENEDLMSVDEAFKRAKDSYRV